MWTIQFLEYAAKVRSYELNLVFHNFAHWIIIGKSCAVHINPVLGECGIENCRVNNRKWNPDAALKFALDGPPRLGQRRKKISVEVRQAVWKRDPRCRWCGVDLAYESMTIDHVIPVGRGGSDKEENLAACCHACNQKKQDSLVPLEHQMPDFELITGRKQVRAYAENIESARCCASHQSCVSAHKVVIISERSQGLEAYFMGADVATSAHVDFQKLEAYISSVPDLVNEFYQSKRLSTVLFDNKIFP